jgi:hypothetical protein
MDAKREEVSMSATKVLIEAEMSAPGLDKAAAVIAGLRKLVIGQEAASPVPDVPAPSTIPAAAKVQALWDRDTSPDSWNLLHTMAEHPAGTEVTFLGLYTELGISDGRLKAWHRNLCREITPINKKLGDDPPFLVDRWDGTKQHYSVPDEVRDAVLKLGRK